MTNRQWLLDSTNGTTVVRAALLSVDGVAATTVNTGGSPGTITYSSTAHAGSTSARMVGGGTATQQIRLPFVAGSAAGAISFYHRAATLPPSTYLLLNVRHSGGELFRVGINASGSLEIHSAAGIQIASSPANGWAVNRWNRIEVVFNNAGGVGAGTVTASVFNGDSTTAPGSATSSTADLGTAVATTIDLGTPQQSTSTWEHFFDSIQMDNGRTTFIGPYLAATPAPVVNALSPITIGPGEARNIVATLASGSADSWTWRQISGPTVSLSSAGNTLSITGPSVLPPNSGTAVFGVKAIDDSVESAEVTATVSILPQLSWTRVPGGDWVGSRIVPA